MIVWYCEWADDLCDRGEFYVDHRCYRTREEAEARAREIEAAGEEDEDCRTTVHVEWMRILYGTDRLRKALDERGIEWHRNDDFEDFTEWEDGDVVYTSLELDDGSLSIQTIRSMTVEEVVAEMSDTRRSRTKLDTGRGGGENEQPDNAGA